jgi:GNAT superfamily N-acetyltransferase
MITFISSNPDNIYFSVIADAIAEENKRKPHMIPETAEHLKEQSLKHGFVITKIQWEVAWFIKLSLLSPEYQIYERGSLIVLPAFRGSWLGEKLIHTITERNSHLSMLSVTTESHVKRVNWSHVWFQVEILRQDIPSKLLEIIEWPQALLPDDSVFINTQLSSRINNGEFS